MLYNFVGLVVSNKRRMYICKPPETSPSHLETARVYITIHLWLPTACSTTQIHLAIHRIRREFLRFFFKVTALWLFLLAPIMRVTGCPKNCIGVWSTIEQKYFIEFSFFFVLNNAQRILKVFEKKIAEIHWKLSEIYFLQLTIQNFKSQILAIFR